MSRKKYYFNSNNLRTNVYVGFVRVKHLPVYLYSRISGVLTGHRRCPRRTRPRVGNDKFAFRPYAISSWRRRRYVTKLISALSIKKSARSPSSPDPSPSPRTPPPLNPPPFPGTPTARGCHIVSVYNNTIGTLLLLFTRPSNRKKTNEKKKNEVNFESAARETRSGNNNNSNNRRPGPRENRFVKSFRTQSEKKRRGPFSVARASVDARENRTSACSPS